MTTQRFRIYLDHSTFQEPSLCMYGAGTAFGGASGFCSLDAQTM